ncbi:MAG TPA: hypothetical protein ENL33_00510 [Candidatus Parcubacteria bacterium]|nr:hypothetical protein [Candidatus Parcubacteria bacterium]
MPLKQLDIFNSQAGSFSRWEIKQIHQILNQNPQTLEERVITTNDPEYLEFVLYKNRDYRPDILGIGGGDGTKTVTLTAVKKIWGYLPPYLAFFASGTNNNCAYTFQLSDGLTDKIKKILPSPIKIIAQPQTKPIQLAQYIQKTLQEGGELKTEPLDLLDVNGKKGFNVGFAAVPKLLWTYYGKTIDQYKKLEKALQKTDPAYYQKELEMIWHEQNPLSSFIEIISNGNENLLKRTGALYTLGTTLLSILSSFNPLNKRRKNFYQEPFEGEIFLDGEKVPLKNLTAIYISTYEQVNLGIKLKPFTFYPTPEARTEPGKMQVVLCSSTILDIVKQISRLWSGKHLQNLHYALVKEVKLTSPHPIIGHIDADFEIADQFTIKYDQTIKVISPFSTAHRN